MGPPCSRRPTGAVAGPPQAAAAERCAARPPPSASTSRPSRRRAAVAEPLSRFRRACRGAAASPSRRPAAVRPMPRLILSIISTMSHFRALTTCPMALSPTVRTARFCSEVHAAASGRRRAFVLSPASGYAITRKRPPEMYIEPAFLAIAASWSFALAGVFPD